MLEIGHRAGRHDARIPPQQPVPYFLGLLALPPYFPVHPDLAQRAQPTPFAEGGLIGNGPYLLEAFDVRDQIRPDTQSNV
ncbi:MAG: hypothetical protein M5U19_13440 [Microthrixaceae bacterium]|nr:hypothetical protein [Microthrixaceae bacterium]